MPDDENFEFFPGIKRYIEKRLETEPADKKPLWQDAKSELEGIESILNSSDHRDQLLWRYARFTNRLGDALKQ
jgi:hypothetical protein